MARKAREILKAQGYSDAELDGLTMLNDPKFCKAVEAEDVRAEQLASENARVKQDLAATTRWYHEEANPMLQQYQGEVVQTRSRIAQLEAQLKAEQDLGMRRVAADQGAGGGAGAGTGDGQAQAQPRAQAAAASPADPQYVDVTTFKQAFDQTGAAIAIAVDIGEDYRDLFGKRMPGGAEGLRNNYLKARETGFRGTLRDFAEREFKFDDRRSEQTAKAQEDRDNRIRQEERQKVLSEHMNPNTRMPESSRSPFVRKPIANGTTEGAAQPWDRGNTEQRRSQRVVKFGTKVLNGSAA